MRFGSVCSGIEAASMAWMPLGWEPAWFSEIEPFPCAVLKHHHPDVPNHGDMTTLPARILAGEVEAPDVLVGGTPCQAFSVAGLRQGLNDPRGRLTRTYVEICDAIDTIRAAAGKPPVILVWENVPGVLSDNGNAFGNFLGALSGEDGPLNPPGGKWTNAGLVCGPTRDLAWRVLDAQYFGVAQRRRRVFLVGHSRVGALRPVKVLLVEQGVQRHSPPSREAGQRAAPTLAARTRGGGGLGTDFDLDGGLVRHDGGRGGVAYGFQPRISRNGRGDMGDLVNALNAQSGETGKGDAAPCVAHVVAPPVVGFQTRGSNIDVGAISGTLGTNADRASGSAPMIAHVVAPPQTEYPEVAEVCGTISDGAHNGGGLNGQDAYTGRILPVAFTGDGVCVTGDRTHALKAEGADGSEDGTGRGTPIVTSIGFYPTEGRDFPAFNELSPTVKVGSGGTSGNPPGVMSAMAVDTYNGTITGDVAVPLSTMGGAGNTGPSAMVNMAVRRLTPVECERLQGFPDEYTRIPWKNKPMSECPDGPRYKALGNSMAVPCMMWIGQQIQKALV